MSLVNHVLEDIKLPTPIELLSDSIPGSRGVKLYVKRDDLIHPLISGNKWRKLEGYISAIDPLRCHQITTFGGPFSNHLMAVAAVAQLAGLKSKGYVRAYRSDYENIILAQLRSMHMELEFLAPPIYTSVKDKYTGLHDEEMFIPEGGAGEMALPGIGVMWKEIISAEIGNFTHLVLAVGTGTTLAGLAAVIPKEVSLIGFSPFKSVPFELAPLQKLIKDGDVQLYPSGFRSRFGAYHRDILPFIDRFFHDYGLLLDPIYTARAMAGLLSSIRAGLFSVDAKILFIHTGGLVGLQAYVDRYHNKIEMDYPAALRWLASPSMTRG